MRHILTYAFLARDATFPLEEVGRPVIMKVRDMWLAHVLTHHARTLGYIIVDI